MECFEFTIRIPKPRRRWLQFSLRTLFLVVMMLCVWLAVITKQTRDQRLSVEAIRKVGGDVVYAHVLEQSDPPGPGWLRRLIGDEYFFSVSILELNHSEVGDRDLAACGVYLEQTFVFTISSAIERPRFARRLLSGYGVSKSGLPYLFSRLCP